MFDETKGWSTGMRAVESRKSKFESEELINESPSFMLDSISESGISFIVNLTFEIEHFFTAQP